MTSNIDHSHNKSYSTTDTALAAWLYSQGFELTGVDISNFPSVFSFKNNGTELQKLVHDFQIGKAEGNIGTFFRSYKRLLMLVKTGFTE